MLLCLQTLISDTSSDVNERSEVYFILRLHLDNVSQGMHALSYLADTPPITTVQLIPALIVRGQSGHNTCPIATHFLGMVHGRPPN